MDDQYNNIGDKIGSSYIPSEIKKKNPQGENLCKKFTKYPDSEFRHVTSSVITIYIYIINSYSLNYKQNFFMIYKIYNIYMCVYECKIFID